METRANYVLIGAFTLIGLIGALGFLLWLAKVEVDKRYAYYDVMFEDVSGLGDAADVRYNGLPIGQVTGVALDTTDPSKVRVTLEVDATVPIESMRMLPAGHLREPLESLRRAHGVIITRSHGVDEALASRIEALHGKPPLAWTEHRWSGIEWEAGGVRHSEENAWLEGKRFVCRLGVGNPGAVRAQLLEAGAEIVEDIQVRDHAPFEAAEVQRLVRMGDAVDGIFMTAKDRVKAQPLLDAGCTVPLVVPRLQLRFHSGQAALVALLEGVMSG